MQVRILSANPRFCKFSSCKLAPPKFLELPAPQPGALLFRAPRPGSICRGSAYYSIFYHALAASAEWQSQTNLQKSKLQKRKLKLKEHSGTAEAQASKTRAAKAPSWTNRDMQTWGSERYLVNMLRRLWISQVSEDTRMASAANLKLFLPKISQKQYQGHGWQGRGGARGVIKYRIGRYCLGVIKYRIVCQAIPIEYNEFWYQN